MNRTGRFSLSALCVASCFFAIAIQAEETIVRSYLLPDHGNVQLKVPTSWESDLRQPPHRLPPTITFKAKTGKPFEILITPIWPASKEQEPMSFEKLKQLVQQGAERAKSQAVEKTVPMQELKGPSGMGYYFAVTDRAPGPEEYKYMTQGMIRVDNLTITFTILTNDGQENVTNDALSMLKSAAHLAGDKI
jgi:hypothetical protein